MNAVQTARFDTPAGTDNRNYDYTGVAELARAEYPIIEAWIPSGATVLDFGCGNGSLLRRLARKGVRGLGWDISESGVAECRAGGVDASLRQIDRAHPDVADKSYDFAVCNVTIQMTMHPEVLLAEMVRIGRRQIISFPNFAHYRNRIDLAVQGRMPHPLLFGYDWYSTGHIHQLSIRDFHRLVATTGGTAVLEMRGVPSRTPIGRTLRSVFPNFFELIPVFLLG